MDNPFYISNNRKLELIYFCKQYVEWENKLNSLNEFAIRVKVVDSTIIDCMPGVSDPASSLLSSRERYEASLDIVDEALDLTAGDNEELREGIFDVVCLSKSFDEIVKEGFTYSEDDFILILNKFFYILDKLRDSL
jgi:hypothetical protein